MKARPFTSPPGGNALTVRHLRQVLLWPVRLMPLQDTGARSARHHRPEGQDDRGCGRRGVPSRAPHRSGPAQGSTPAEPF